MFEWKERKKVLLEIQDFDSGKKSRKMKSLGFNGTRKLKCPKKDEFRSNQLFQPCHLGWIIGPQKRGVRSRKTRSESKGTTVE